MNKRQLIKYLKSQSFSKRITNAFSKVERENFISSALREKAYENIALSIGPVRNRQAISQPYTIAVMVSLLELRENQKVLEIGSGSGYVLALISKMIQGKFFGIEIVKEIAEKSEENLKNYKNIKIYNKSGEHGLSEKAPFDRILISASLEKIPNDLPAQLKEKGIIVAPIGPTYGQTLTSFQKIKGKLKIKRKIEGFSFVPFV